jgi:hypothetical protein
MYENVGNNETLEDDLILAEAQRRMRIAGKLDRPFFLTVGFHKPVKNHNLASLYGIVAPSAVYCSGFF